ncbi:MAG: hypothetical protein ACYCZ6_17820 [Polaromonas sp.]
MKLGHRQAVGAQAAVGFVPEGWGQGQPAVTVNDGAQRWVVGLWHIDGARTQVVQVVAPVLGDADHLAGTAALGHVNQKSVACFFEQEAQANDLAGGGCSCAGHVY